MWLVDGWLGGGGFGEWDKIYRVVEESVVVLLELNHLKEVIVAAAH